MPLDDDLPTETDVLIVGSGFGGSVMAAELAGKGYEVCVLERGRAYPPGSFPRDPAGISLNFWDPDAELTGMFDVWSFQNVDAVVSSGLGGGSLIYANVMLPKDESWFTQTTPDGTGVETWALTREHLKEHYTAVSDFLRVQTLPNGPADNAFHLPKTKRFLKIDAPDGGERAVLAPLAVRFRDDNGQPSVGAPLRDEAYGNIHGAGYHRRTCRLCGECDLGCNDGAKSSMDNTYLSLASDGGVSIQTLTEVVGLARRAAGDGYLFDVTVKVHGDRPQPTEPIRAKRVVLAAGTLGSTYLLLRHRDALNINSDALGHRFSGNGDYLGFVHSADTDLACTRGPVITAYRHYPGTGGTHGMYIEDAGYPAFAAWLMQLGRVGGMAMTAMGKILVRKLGDLLDVEENPNMSEEINDILKNGSFSAGFMPLLGMGRDRPDGRLYLDEDDDEVLRNDWSLATSEAYFDTMKARMRNIARGFGGKFTENLISDFFKRVITVHPVGGCPMDTDVSPGVIDTFGRVRGVPGLRVCDGSVFPGPVGPNPSLTIAAFAHRSAGNLLAERDFTPPPHPADEFGQPPT
ncbi:MAG: GMC family oxidoreductase [Mycolicibacterium cosmeticum]|nr:GMC family oxidoreductase [Mycolicibacterium cosmeticum]